MKPEKKRQMDLPEDVLRLVNNEQMKDMNEMELRFIYKQIIELKKIRK